MAMYGPFTTQSSYWRWYLEVIEFNTSGTCHNLQFNCYLAHNGSGNYLSGGTFTFNFWAGNDQNFVSVPLSVGRIDVANSSDYSAKTLIVSGNVNVYDSALSNTTRDIPIAAEFTYTYSPSNGTACKSGTQTFTLAATATDKPSVTAVKYTQDGTTGFTVHVQTAHFDEFNAPLYIPTWTAYNGQDDGPIWYEATKTTHTVDGVTYHWKQYISFAKHNNEMGQYINHFYWSNSDAVDGIKSGAFTPSVLTVNYYSNYATEAYSGALNKVGADKNVLIGQWVVTPSSKFPDNLHNYVDVGSTMYLGRKGYTGTGYWGTTPKGGTLIRQDEDFTSYNDMASRLGVSSSGIVSVILYAQWNKNSNIRLKIGDIWKEGKAWVKVNNIWREGSNVYAKVNGAFKESV